MGRQGLELRILYVLRWGCERYGVNERNEERNGAEGSGGVVNRLAGEAHLDEAMERSGIASSGVCRSRRLTRKNKQYKPSARHEPASCERSCNGM